MQSSQPGGRHTDSSARRRGACSKGRAAGAMDRRGVRSLALRILGVAACAVSHAKSHAQDQQNSLKLGDAISRSPMEHAVAIAYIVTGSADREVFLPLSLNNLRRTGGWRGDVFVLTDNPKCVPESMATSVLLPKPPPRQGHYSFSNYAKKFKMMLLEVLPLRSEHQHVFYLDTDVFVGRPVGPFLFKAIQSAAAIGATISLFREGTGKNGQADHSERLDPLYRSTLESADHRALIKAQLDAQPCSRNFSLYHGGVFLVDRTNGSAACLARWAEWSDTPCHLDQPFLTRAVMAGDCRVNALSLHEHFGQPTAANTGKYWTFNHFTRTSRMQGSDGIEKKDLTIAGEQLLGLTGELAKSWWNLHSPYCV